MTFPKNPSDTLGATEVNSRLYNPIKFIVSQDSLGDYTGTDEVPIQAAIDAAEAAGGGIVLVKAGTYTINNSLTMNGHVTLMGEGQEETEFRAKTNLNNYILIINSANTAGNASGHFRVKVMDIKFDGNISNQSADSGGILAYGTIQSTFERCHFEECRGKGIWLYDCSGGSDPFSNDNFGHHNQIINCLFDQSEGSAGDGIGIYMRYNDENSIIGCQFQYLNLDIKDETGFNNISDCSFVNGRDGIQVLDSWRTGISNCVFDYKGRRAIWLKGYRNTVTGCRFYKISDGNSNGYSCIDIDYYGSNVITGNAFNSHDTNGVTKYLIEESTPTHATKGYNVITNNRFTILGTMGTGQLGLSETTNIVHSNSGYTEAENIMVNSSGEQFAMNHPFTKIGTITLSATTAEQTFSVPSGYKYLMVAMRVYKAASSGSGTFGMRLNSATSGYKQNKVAYSTLTNPNTTAFKFCSGTTGTIQIGGTVFLHVTEVNSDNTSVTGNVYAADQEVWFGGRVDAGGDISSIKFDDYDSDSAFTGEIVIWGSK